MWSFWISDSWQRSHTRSILWINQLPKSNTSLHIELKASHIKSFSAGCGTHWPRGEKGVGYAGYDAINVRSQHGLDCMDWLGRSVRGLGKTFTINQSWPGPGAPQQVAAAQFPSGRTRTSSVNIVNTDGAWHAVDRSGAFEWNEWIEERKSVKSIDIDRWPNPEKSKFQLKLESVSYCIAQDSNLTLGLFVNWKLNEPM